MASNERATGDDRAAGEPAALGELIRRRRRALGWTLAEAAERVGCHRSYLSNLERGQREKPSEAMIVRLARALEMDEKTLRRASEWARAPESVRRGVSSLHEAARATSALSALLRRDGLDEAYRSGELGRVLERLRAGDTERVSAALPHEVPVINSVTAGYPHDFGDLGYPARVADEYVRCPDLHDPDAFAARVVGDSMEPTYVEGDLVVFSPIRDAESGSDCFVRLEPDHESTFKRVYFETGEAGEELIRIQPINNRYPPRVVPRDRVAGLYRAVSLMRRVP